MHALEIPMQALSTGTLMCFMYQTLEWLFQRAYFTMSNHL